METKPAVKRNNLMAFRSENGEIKYLDLDTGKVVQEYAPSTLEGNFTNDMADIICDMIRCGETLKTTLSTLQVPQSVFYGWLSIFPDFKRQYTEARKQRADYHYHKAIEIADGAIGASKDLIPGFKLATDTHKWAAEKLNPADYGNDKGGVATGGVHITLNTGVLDVKEKPDIIVDEFGNFKGFNNGTVTMDIDTDESFDTPTANIRKERFAEYEPITEKEEG